MEQLTGKQVFLWASLLTVVIEAFTVVLRFGFKLEAARDTASTIGALTYGIRIHHGYIGVLLIAVALFCLKVTPILSRWMLVAGIALFCSDMIHHFLVLWPIVGDPEFHLVYPPG